MKLDRDKVIVYARSGLRSVKSAVGIALSLALAGATAAYAADGGPVSGNSVIRAKAGDSEIVITTTSPLAGAIHSLTWGGKEFINSHDHGRQLQTAWNADAGIDPIQGETFNPTEAGSRDDDQGDKTSSKLLELHAKGNMLETLTQPAFWLARGSFREGSRPGTRESCRTIGSVSMW